MIGLRATVIGVARSFTRLTGMTDVGEPSGQLEWLDDYQGLSLDEAKARAEAEGRPVRVVPRNGVVTLDFRPSRLNLCLDDDGNLARMFAG